MPRISIERKKVNDALQKFKEEDYRYKLIFFIMSYGKKTAHDICEIKLSDINENGILGIDLTNEPEILYMLAKYLRKMTNVENMEHPLFPGRGAKALTVNNLILALKKIFKKLEIDPKEFNIDLSLRRKDIMPEDITMATVLDILKEKFEQAKNQDEDAISSQLV